MKIKKIIGFLVHKISKKDLSCDECEFLYQDKALAPYCGIFDENLPKKERCSGCVELFESVESNCLISVKYPWTKKDEKLIGK